MEWIYLYLILAITFVWWRASLLFISEARKKIDYPPFTKKVTIIIPTYNENKYMLVSLVESVLYATRDIDAEIIIGDDGSKTKVEEILSSLDKAKLEKIKILTLPHQGKKETQEACFRYSTGEVIITMDSDILMEKNAIYELIKPFNDTKVGASTSNIKILNEDDNWLTKATGTLYWNSFNVARKSLSVFGIVNICSGALSAYKREAFQKVLNRYINQKFLGKKCVHGDDRALTNLILKEDYKVKYIDKSICYTISPNNLFKFIKQQYRWRQSGVREGLICLSFSFKKNKLLFIETFFVLSLPFVSIAILITIILYAIKFPFIIPGLLIGILITTLIHNLLLIIENPKRFYRAFIFTILNYLFLLWLWPIALINVRSENWGTR